MVYQLKNIQKNAMVIAKELERILDSSNLQEVRKFVGHVVSIVIG